MKSGVADHVWSLEEIAALVPAPGAKKRGPYQEAREQPIILAHTGGTKMAKKETIKPPTKRELTSASKDLKRGDPSGARTMADKSVAVRQGASKGKPKGKR